jgi:hypothetical protein
MTEKPRISGLPGLNTGDVIKLSQHLASVLNCDEKSLHDEIIKYVRENYVSDAKDTKIKWYFEEQDQ